MTGRGRGCRCVCLCVRECRSPVQVLILCKQPVPGRVKTRLSPALTPKAAAALAAAALADTIDAVSKARVARRVLVVDGVLSAPGFEVVAQRGDGLDERLAAAFADVMAGAALPTLLIGMDTPQVTAALIEQACARLLRRGTDAVLGLAADGGWWALGLQTADERLLLGVPASRADTGRLQRDRLDRAGLVVGDLPMLRDVDTIADAHEVASLAPATRFAAELRRHERCAVLA